MTPPNNTHHHPNHEHRRGEEGLPIVGRATLFLLLQEAWERGVPFDLHQVRLLEADLLSGRFFNADLSGVLASEYRFSHPQGRSLFQRVCFRQAHLSRADFQDCRFQACSFREADLSEANFRSALFEANSPLDFLYTDLSGATFSYSRLEGADLRGANAPKLSAVRAQMAFSDFRGANLTGADFTGADLRCCDFERANLTGAILLGAIIEGADFTSTRLSGSGLERVRQVRGDGKSYVFVQWRHKDTALPAPIPPAVLNHPYNGEYLAAPPVLTEEEIAIAYEEYSRWYDAHGKGMETGPDEDEEGDEEPVYNENEQKTVEGPFPEPDDPFLPDFPDD